MCVKAFACLWGMLGEHFSRGMALGRNALSGPLGRVR